jgi:hypothetical protein
MLKPYKNNWLSFYPSKYDFRIMFKVAGYFDNRPEIVIFVSQIFSIILFLIFGFKTYSWLFLIPMFFCWGTLYINLPIKTKYDECDPPRYGVYYHERCFWFCYGRKTKCIHMPYDWNWFRTSVLLKDGTWEHETKGNRKDFYKDVWKEKILLEEYSYTYVLKNGTVQRRLATIKVEEMEWRRRWLTWTKFGNKINKSIDVEFSYGGPFVREILFEKKMDRENWNRRYKHITGEVGERTGSWKGGTIGCGYTMLEGETPLQTLRRMEKERKF